MENKERLKRIGLFLFGILAFHLSTAQENYIAGYIIKQDKDTINGYIDYRDWGVNPNQILFKKRKSSPTFTLYTPLDIKGFNVEGETYQSGIVESENTDLKIAELEEGPLLKIELDTIFLQTLFSGKKELFYYKNKEQRENFYIRENGKFDLLVYKKYFKFIDGKQVIMEDKTYKGQLISYLDDCPTIQTELRNSAYDLKKMYNLFELYGECMPSNISFQREKDETIVEFGALAGVSLTSIDFGGDEFFSYLIEPAFTGSVNASIGLYIDLVLPRNHGKWSINNEVLFSSYSFNKEFEDFKNENDFSFTQTEIAFTYIKINNLGRYKHPIGAGHLYFNAGVSYGVSTSETNVKRSEKTTFTITNVKVTKAIETIRKYELGFILGAGMKYKRYSVELRYERGSGMSRLAMLSAKTRRFFCLFGYRF